MLAASEGTYVFKSNVLASAAGKAGGWQPLGGLTPRWAGLLNPDDASRRSAPLLALSLGQVGNAAYVNTHGCYRVI